MSQFVRTCVQMMVAPLQRRKSRAARVQLLEVLSLLSTTSRISLRACARQLGMSVREVQRWVEVLVRHDVVRLETVLPSSGAYQTYAHHYQQAEWFRAGTPLTFIVKNPAVSCIDAD